VTVSVKLDFLKLFFKYLNFGLLGFWFLLKTLKTKFFKPISRALRGCDKTG